jgi:type II secretory ATPase GspE/PulE/Tfp pilus assembly ATPase PilB-like protein
VDAGDDLLLPLAREYSTGLPGKQVDNNALIAAWRGEYGVDGRIVLYRARGCGECSGTGYKGRIGLLELMSASSEIKRMIIDGASAAALFDVALAQGMQTLKQDGIHKVLSGITELSQVLAVSQR